MTARCVSPEELIRELEQRLRPGRQSALAFDADGTLWSGDVGDDVFRFAVAHGRLREAARPALEKQAEARGFERFADVNATAKLLFDAYIAGRYPEREMCELMTWCYAGHTVTEMQELVRQALEATHHAQRLHTELEPVLRFARGRGLRVVVISASPRITVEVAAGAWGIDPKDIVASTARVDAGTIAPEMSGALPYAHQKSVAGRSLLGQAHWLASFGDNGFDVEMMQEAELGVAVRPKPALCARLQEIPGVLQLGANF